MFNKPRNKYGIDVSIIDVLKEFWVGLKKFKFLLFVSILAPIITSVIGIFVPLQYKIFFDILNKQDPNSTSQLVHIIAVIAIMHFFAWISFRLGMFADTYLQSRTMAILRQNAFSKLMEHSYSFFTNNFTGALVQRISRFARAFEKLMDRLIFNIIPLGVSIIGASIVLWQINPMITYILLVWLMAFMLFNYFFSKWKLKYNLRAAESDSYTTAVLSDNITNHNTIQLFENKDYENEHVKNVTLEQARNTYIDWNISGIVDAVQAGLLIIVEFILFYLAIGYWQTGIFTIGTFVLMQAYFLTLGEKLWSFSRIIRDFYEGFADAKEMVEIMKLPNEIIDLPGVDKLIVKSGKIEFKNVCFSFNKTRNVITNLNLKISGGEKVAIVGPSGAGKSTFVRLILRLYEVSGGSIFVDEQNIQHVTQKSLRENISFVPQDPVLFHRSLKENIKYGKLNATDKEIIEAAKLAHCDEFISNLPLGYETHVGERGIKLSGGERQRIAIARAILKNAPILILDEATSSLDSDSEHLIQDALNVLMKNKTVIVIAHRLSTIRKMDRIIVFKDGIVTEDGTHESLLKKEDGLYAKLWNLQAGGFLKEE